MFNLRVLEINFEVLFIKNTYLEIDISLRVSNEYNFHEIVFVNCN